MSNKSKKDSKTVIYNNTDYNDTMQVKNDIDIITEIYTSDIAEIERQAVLLGILDLSDTVYLERN